MKKTSKGQRPIFFNVFLCVILYLIGIRACSPPGIVEGDVLKTIVVEDVYYDIRNTTNVPVKVMGEIASSFYIGVFGGVYFLQSPYSKKTIIGFTKEIPPEQGANVSVLGVVKPAIYNGSINLLYLKTENIEEVFASEKKNSHLLIN